MDSRFTLKGTFSIYGKSFPMDMSLNWSPRRSDDIDHRITEFIQDAYNEAHACHMDAMDDERGKREREEIEAKERAEFERLKAKYGNE